MNTTIARTLALVSVAMVAACNDGSSEPPKSPQTTGAPTEQGPSTMAPSTSNVDPGASRAPASPPTTVDPTPAPAPTPAPTMLSDGEIAGFVSAANKGEIAMAQVATKSSQNAKVKAFANMMIQQHGDAEAKGKKVVDKEKISVVDTATPTTTLKSDVESTMTTLKSAKGADFDKAYMDAQVKAHKDVLSAIDDKLLPAVKDAELKTHLQEVRKHVEMHLQKAEEIRQGLTASGTGTATPASTMPAKK